MKYQVDYWSQATIWVGSFSVLMFFGSIVLAWVIIVRLPSDYLTRDQLGAASFRSRHPVMRAALLVVKNVFGLALLATGVVMLLTPGQGMLCIFIGLTLMDFPGKRQWIHRLLGRRGVLHMINRIREKADRQPLKIPPENQGASSAA